METMNDFGDLGNPHAPSAGREQRYNRIMEAIFLSGLVLVIGVNAASSIWGWIVLWRAWVAGVFRAP